MTVASLVDTNILVYRFDARFPRKQQIATELLRTGIAQGSPVGRKPRRGVPPNE